MLHGAAQKRGGRGKRDAVGMDAGNNHERAENKGEAPPGILTRMQLTTGMAQELTGTANLARCVRGDVGLSRLTDSVRITAY